MAVDPSGEFSYATTSDQQSAPATQWGYRNPDKYLVTLLEAGVSQLFIATAQNGPANKGVTWHAGDGSCPEMDCGAIDSTGKHTASANMVFYPISQLKGVGISADGRGANDGLSIVEK